MEPPADLAPRVAAVERWFVQRGVPHLIEHYDAPTDIWTRALPLLGIAYVAGGLNALDLRNWSVAQNLAAAVAVLAVLAAGWALTNLVEHRPALAVPQRIGVPELAAFVLGPAVPSALFGQWGDALQSLVAGLIVLGLVYLGTSYGVVPLTRWALGRVVSQVVSLANLVVRALPLLLLFTTFLFINAEVWQVAGTLEGLPYVAVLGVFFLFGAVFVLSRVPATMQGLGHFDTWEEVASLTPDTPASELPVPSTGTPPTTRLRIRQRLNVGLVTVFSQALQVTFVAVVLTAFFALFGLLAIPADTQAGWTGLADVHVLATWTVSGRELVITEPLLRVAGFLGAFSGMYFTVVLSTDDTYREEFAEDVGPQVRQVLAVHAAYLVHVTRPHPNGRTR